MSRATKMNSITSPELWAQVNPENKQLLSDFLAYLRSVQRSETTIQGYENDIQIAFVWGLQYNKNEYFVNWTKRSVVSYQNWLLNNNNNSPARVRRLKAALSSLSNYICNILDDEYPNFRNIINKIESPANQPVREKTVWTDEDIEALLDILVKNKDYEKACLVALAAYSGRRKAELCRFKTSDFDASHLVCDGALYKSDPIKSKGRGNGKYINCYVLAKKFQPYLEMWMNYRKEHNIESQWLFPSREDMSKQISLTTLNSWARTLTRLSGRDVYFHSFRHAFTSALVRAGIPDSVIQTLVAWESADMVRLYDDATADEQISMYFKDGDINIPVPKGFNNI